MSSEEKKEELTAAQLARLEFSKMFASNGPTAASQAPKLVMDANGNAANHESVQDLLTQQAPFINIMATLTDSRILDKDLTAKDIAGMGFGLVSSYIESKQKSLTPAEYAALHRFENLVIKNPAGDWQDVSYHQLKNLDEDALSTLSVKKRAGVPVEMGRVQAQEIRNLNAILTEVGSVIGLASGFGPVSALTTGATGAATGVQYVENFDRDAQEAIQFSTETKSKSEWQSKIDARIKELSFTKSMRDTEKEIFNALKTSALAQAENYADKNTNTGIGHKAAVESYMRDNFDAGQATLIGKAMGLGKAVSPELHDFTSIEDMREALGQLEALNLLTDARAVYDGSVALNSELAHNEAQSGINVDNNTINNSTDVHVAAINITSHAADLDGTLEDAGRAFGSGMDTTNYIQGTTA